MWISGRVGVRRTWRGVRAREFVPFLCVFVEVYLLIGNRSTVLVPPASKE